MGNAKRKEDKQQQAILWEGDVLKAARRAVHYTPGLSLNYLVNQAVIRRNQTFGAPKRGAVSEKKGSAFSWKAG